MTYKYIIPVTTTAILLLSSYGFYKKYIYTSPRIEFDVAMEDINRSSGVPSENSDSISLQNKIECPPLEMIVPSREMIEIFDINSNAMDFFQLLKLINNYLYNNDLLVLQQVRMNESLKKLLNSNEQILPYYLVIETIIDRHVTKY